MTYSISMLLCCIILIPSVLISTTTSSFTAVVAWAPQQHPKHKLSAHRHSSHDRCIKRTDDFVRFSKPTFGRHQHIFSTRKPDDESYISTKSNIVKSIQSIFTATTVLTVGWWVSSVAVPFLPQSYDNTNNFNPIILNVANAKEMASGSGSRVNKDPESLLRYGLPIQNKEVRIYEKLCIPKSF